MGGNLRRAWVIAALLTATGGGLPCLVRAAGATTTCQLPSGLGLTVEERPLFDRGGGGLVVVRSDAPSSLLRPGDVIRQANGRRTSRCADLEATAAEAAAKGLLLLLAAERDGGVVATALADASSRAPIVAAAPAEPAAEALVPTPPSAPAPSAAGLPAAERAAAPTPEPSTAAIREAALPARDEAAAEVATKAVAAAAVLGTVDAAARFAVPAPVYERRIDDARNAIRALRIEGEGASAVQRVIDEGLGYHEAARDIRRYKSAELAHARIDQRGAGATSLPYFSDSEVPRWVERYPFLSKTLQQAPRATHMLLPGEMAGRWNPDLAVELLWQRAAATAERLGAWAGDAR